jgi:RimJ/RimL family protein N-acetyltransferase
MIPGPAYRIVTSRLVIRCYNPSDAILLTEAVQESVEHLKPWMPWAHTEDKETLQTRIDRLRRFRSFFDQSQDFIYGIFSPGEKRLLGGTGLHTRLGPGTLEIGYWIHKDFINQGLATETASALTRVGFEIHNVQRMEIHCDPGNFRSASVPRKLGYTLEATLLKHTPFLDEWRDSQIWVLHREAYNNSPASKFALEAYDAAGRKIELS